jgi:hypothetical protein
VPTREHRAANSLSSAHRISSYGSPASAGYGSHATVVDRATKEEQPVVTQSSAATELVSANVGQRATAITLIASPLNLF